MSRTILKKTKPSAQARQKVVEFLKQITAKKGEKSALARRIGAQPSDITYWLKGGSMPGWALLRIFEEYGQESAEFFGVVKDIKNFDKSIFPLDSETGAVVDDPEIDRRRRIVRELFEWLVKDPSALDLLEKQFGFLKDAVAWRRAAVITLQESFSGHTADVVAKEVRKGLVKYGHRKGESGADTGPGDESARRGTRERIPRRR